MRNSQQKIEILDTQNVPEDGESELEAELTAAREVRAAKINSEGPNGGVCVPAIVHSPRLSSLSVEELEEHVERLERDLQLSRWKWGGCDE
jgi:hypothetical protein